MHILRGSLPTQRVPGRSIILVVIAGKLQVNEGEVL